MLGKCALRRPQGRPQKCASLEKIAAREQRAKCLHGVKEVKDAMRTDAVFLNVRSG